MQLVVGGGVVMTGAVVGMRVVLGTVDDIMGVELAIPNFASVAPLLKLCCHYITHCNHDLADYHVLKEFKNSLW